ncbi:MAG: family 43 glycosylhydrolase [Clostridia bacterium]|nr:family 43 glycosylhydrolase [Clostridia bacterium]
MKGLMMLILFAAALLNTAFAENYQNPIPVQNDRGINMDAADPFVLRFNGRYYLYTTGAEEIRVYESEDLVHWTFRGHCTRNGEGRIAYAPEVFYWRGAFYMITSPSGNGHYIMRSDSPLGPFDRVTENFGYSIDGSLFAGDDGKLYMLNLPGNRSISITEIDESRLIPRGVNKSTGVTLNHWTEGPGLIRRGEWYYLTFTGNHYLSAGYRVAWASRKGSPLGRYTQLNDHTLLINSVFKDPFTGLGHSASFHGPDLDSIYASYHCHAPEQTGGGLVRWYNLDRLLTNGGVMYSTGPSDTAMPVPAMPDVYGDAQGMLNGFTETDEGFMAEVNPCTRFTQECNFSLNGGEMAWQMGTRDGKPALITTDGRKLSFTADGRVVANADVPELGETGRLHTLRVECTQDVLYVYIDTMRLLTVKNPAVTADTIGALKRNGAAYSFMAHTARALGDGDLIALKAIPGTFAAVHAVNGAQLVTVEGPELEARAALLGEAAYNSRIAQAGSYCFDLTVRARDAGKTLTLLLDGEVLTAMVIPDAPDRAGWFTFTTDPVALPAGDHTLGLSGNDAAVLTLSAFVHEVMEEKTWALDRNDRKGIITLGRFSAKNGALSISSGTGFALIGGHGCTDYEMRVTFDMPKKGSGFSGFILHATHASTHPDQVAEAAFGYAVVITGTGVNIRRMNYGHTMDVDKIRIDGWKGLSQATLRLQIRDNVLSVFVGDAAEPVAVIRDAAPFTHGMCGLYSTGKELRVTELSVRPLD